MATTDNRSNLSHGYREKNSQTPIQVVRYREFAIGQHRAQESHSGLLQRAFGLEGCPPPRMQRRQNQNEPVAESRPFQHGIRIRRVRQHDRVFELSPDCSQVGIQFPSCGDISRTLFFLKEPQLALEWDRSRFQRFLASLQYSRCRANDRNLALPLLGQCLSDQQTDVVDFDLWSRGTECHLPYWLRHVPQKGLAR